MTALDLAVHGGQVSLLRLLVKHGADVNAASNIAGFTALHHATRNGKPEFIDFLGDAGANIDQEDRIGSTPLHDATCRGPEAVLALLKHGASVSKKDAIGATPLHRSVVCAGRHGTAEVVDLLLRRGADEKAVVTTNALKAVDLVGCGVEDEETLADDVERARKLLANAPADVASPRLSGHVPCLFPRG